MRRMLFCCKRPDQRRVGHGIETCSSYAHHWSDGCSNDMPRVNAFGPSPKTRSTILTSKFALLHDFKSGSVLCAIELGAKGVGGMNALIGTPLVRRDRPLGGAQYPIHRAFSYRALEAMMTECGVAVTTPQSIGGQSSTEPSKWRRVSRWPMAHGRTGELAFDGTSMVQPVAYRPVRSTSSGTR